VRFNVNHKIRFDRGRTYYSYGNSIFTAALVWVFSQGDLVYSIISAILVFTIMYLFGYLDQKLNILSREQGLYSKQNPIIMEILKEIKELRQETHKKVMK